MHSLGEAICHSIDNLWLLHYYYYCECIYGIFIQFEKAHKKFKTCFFAKKNMNRCKYSRFCQFLRLFSHHHLIFHVQMKKKTWYFFTEFKTDTKRAEYRNFINLLSEAKQAKAFKLTNKVVSRSLVCFFYQKECFRLENGISNKTASA